MESNDTSGFTEDIDNEVNNAEQMSVDKHFHDIREIYVSENGYTRLLYATRYGKRYILKCLKADYSYTPVYRQALTKEFEIGLQLDHPNICKTIGMEEVEGYGIAIIIEYVDGMTLQQLIDTGQLTRHLSQKIFTQLTDALAYIHGKQIYHRDLKPQNIMVTYGCQDVRLIDFSLADSESFNILKSPAGTIGYIAPEQLRPGCKADPRADIYSLGMVLQDMAKATGDKRLMRIGKRCAQADIACRPASIGEVRQIAKERHYEAWVAVLSVVCLLFIGCIIAALHRRTSTVTEPTPTYQKANADSNQVMDINEWPGR